MVSSAFGSIGALAALGFVALGSASAPRARSAERQLEDADLMALGYLVEARLDPQAMLDMMRRFMTLKESDLPFYYDYYQARPITQERAAAIQASFNHLNLEGQRFETGFKEYQEISRGVKEIYRR
jgi:predicted Zn-dependent protease